MCSMYKGDTKILNGNVFFGKDNYSTIEQVVGTWIDGKPIYRKTFYSASGWANSGSDAGSVIGNISNLKLVTSLKTVCLNTSGNYWSSSYLDTDQCNVYVKKSTGDVYVINKASFVNNEQLVVVEYVKTTD